MALSKFYAENKTKINVEKEMMIEILMVFSRVTVPDKFLRFYLDSKHIIDEQKELLVNILANVTNERFKNNERFRIISE